jgi:hypothetical protein
MMRPYTAGFGGLVLARSLLVERLVSKPRILEPTDLIILATIALALVLAGTLVLG